MTLGWLPVVFKLLLESIDEPLPQGFVPIGNSGVVAGMVGFKVVFPMVPLRSIITPALMGLRLVSVVALLGLHSGCTPQRMLQFGAASAGAAFQYEGVSSAEVVQRGVEKETYLFNRSMNASVNHPFDLTRMDDFEPVPFTKGDRFELQQVLYVWDRPQMGARNTLNGNRLCLSWSKGPFEYGKESLMPIRQIPRGAIIRFIEHRSYTHAFTVDVPVVRVEGTGEEFILSCAYEFVWLKPKSSARPEEVEKLAFIPKNPDEAR
jgi:hypothetical protein